MNKSAIFLEARMVRDEPIRPYKSGKAIRWLLLRTNGQKVSISYVRALRLFSIFLMKVRGIFREKLVVATRAID